MLDALVVGAFGLLAGVLVYRHGERRGADAGFREGYLQGRERGFAACSELVERDLASGVLRLTIEPPQEVLTMPLGALLTRDSNN